VQAINNCGENSLPDYCETVVLVLKDIVFRHAESKFLSEFLIEKYGFTALEDKVKEIAKPSIPSQVEATEGEKLEATKYATTKILSGNFSDAEIEIYILGEVAQIEDIIEINDSEKYKVYNSKYQLIKIASKSGYAITQLIELLIVNLGIEIKSKEWHFHRSNNR
jgi:hypothetical protein